MVGGGQASTHSAAVANRTRCPAWQARIAMPIARCVLPVPGGPRNTTLSLADHEVQGAQMRDEVTFESAGMVEVELLQ